MTATELAPTPAEIRAAEPVSETGGYWTGVIKRLRRDRITVICGGLLLLIALAAAFAPLIAPHDPYETSMMARLLPPGAAEHPLGTDELGRDMLSRLIYGGRISLFMGLTPVVLATLIGGALGLVAGYLGGAWNTAIMRTMDVFYAFPSVLLAVAISGALGAGLLNGLIALTVVFIPPLTRMAESVTTQARSEDYIEAARATGAGSFGIVRTHVLPNVLGPVFIYASSLISVSIVIASGLSFLGLGVSPPQADWGLMLNTLRQSIYIAPLTSVLPGVLIFVTSISFNLMSDGLRAAMDVKS